MSSWSVEAYIDKALVDIMATNVGKTTVNPGISSGVVVAIACWIEVGPVLTWFEFRQWLLSSASTSNWSQTADSHALKALAISLSL